ncbi:oleate hydratase [Dyadobacter sp. BHUBP1]|uniref:oleate hydratase n=1 Tax=Dyadobacter sp. BHUBP1 TaxID=3424178 RepID=UPI001BFC1EA5
MASHSCTEGSTTHHCKALFAQARLVCNGRVVTPDPDELFNHLLDIRQAISTHHQSENLPIESIFEPVFFDSRTWELVSSLFCLQPWHSIKQLALCFNLIEHHQISIDTLQGLEKTRYNQFDTLIFPTLRWLIDQGVRFRHNSEVTDIIFKQDDKGKLFAQGLTYIHSGEEHTLNLGPQACVFVANGSVASDFSIGEHNSAALMTERPGNDWNLWHSLSNKVKGSGDPVQFVNRIRQTTVVSFTVTSPNKKIFQLMEQLSGNVDGTGGLTTLHASNWQISISLPYQPYFLGQPEHISVFWGYGLSPYTLGNFVKKAMVECSGEEILREIISHLNFSQDQHKIMEGTNCRHLIFPYFTAPLLPSADKPEVVPNGVGNLAFIGQFTNVDDYPCLNIEYAVRSARRAVYKLLGLG